MTKLNLIITGIKAADFSGYKARQIRAAQIAYYKANEDKIKNVGAEYIQSHDFSAELYRKQVQLKKEKLYKPLKAAAVKLERHMYAPEMNAMHFINGKVIKTPQIRDFNRALKYILKHNNILTIEAIFKTN